MKQCDKCGFIGVFIEEQYSQSKIIFCPDCYFSIYEYCKHEKSTLIKYSVNGKFRVQNMCSECFKLHGQFIKQSDINLNEIKTIDKDKHDKYQDDQAEKYRNRYLEINQRYDEWNKKAWFSEYSKYLKTIEWQNKRDEVLKRDNYLCQACLKARATQVHHLSYKHLKHEPYFELVSVCSQCHHEITLMDKGN